MLECRAVGGDGVLVVTVLELKEDVKDAKDAGGDLFRGFDDKEDMGNTTGWSTALGAFATRRS